MHRRAVLAGAAVWITGCAQNGQETPEATGDNSPDTAPATETTATATSESTATESDAPPEIACQEAYRPEPVADAGDEVAPRAYPAPPDGDATIEWVRAHEEAFMLNHLLAEHDLKGWHGLALSGRERQRHGAGVVVRFTYTFGYQEDEVTYDTPDLQTAYYVDDRGALRVTRYRADVSGELDPIADGQPVVCF